MARPTAGSNSRPGGNARATWSAIFAVLSAATMPVAIAGTRYARSYKLLAAGWAIPLGLGLGVAALAAARVAGRRNEQSLGRLGGLRAARFGRIVGTLGICLALTALLSLGVYELLQYLAGRN